jgi:type I restriction enzyme, S subunit
MTQDQTRTYTRDECVTFRKTAEAFGGLSNMAPGFPVRVNGFRFLTSEALYQACRFPHLPEVQRMILAEYSPMTAKMKSKRFREESRADWNWVRVKIMRWCLRVKLAQNWQSFGNLLLSTADKPIVEESRKDDFWGAKIQDDQTLMGRNALGRLLMELREALKTDLDEKLRCVEPLDISDFLLMAQPIEPIGATDKTSTAFANDVAPLVSVPSLEEQPQLFEEPVLFARAHKHRAEQRGTK